MIRRTHARRTARPRRAFTIVELMVVTVVVLILMSILVAASTIATDTVRAAKAQGDHMAQERMALALLRRDLQYSHFLEEDGKTNLGRKLSDQRTDRLDSTGSTLTGYKPPRSGYFFASSPPIDDSMNFDEGADGDGFQSSRSGNHSLQFTIIVPGGAPEDTLTADVPFRNSPATTAYPITGTCAEVAYFLQQNGTTPGGVKKYKLIRRQRLAARNTDDAPAYSALLAAPPPAPPNTVSTPVPTSDSSEVMAVKSGTTVLNLNDLTFATAFTNNRLVQAPITTNRVGEDVLHHSVTSFEVKFTGPQASVFWNSATPVPVWPRPFSFNGALVNTDYPYDNLPFDGKYDTFNQFKDPTNSANPANWDLKSNLASSSAQTAPLKKLRITGAMIRLRCWSPATKTTRQTTIQVDL